MEVFSYNVTEKYQALQAETNRPLRYWQACLKAELDGPINDRSIIWIVDPDGNNGKTWMSKAFDNTQPKRGHTPRKWQKCRFKICLYQDQRIVIFDLSRSQESHINYEVIESIENGVLSTKYEAAQKVYAIPHVVIFANFEPDRSKLSWDRWDVRKLVQRLDSTDVTDKEMIEF